MIPNLAHRTRPLAIVLACVVALAGVLAPVGVAHADEILPGVDVLSVTVTGPGLDEPVRMADEDAATFIKGVVGSGLFVPEIARPPESAEVYTARYETMVQGNPGKGKVLFAWDGTNGWVSGEALLERGEYTVAAPVIIEAMADVLAQVEDHKSTEAPSEKPASSEDSDGSNGLAIGVVVAVVVVLAGVLAWLLVRRRRTTTG